jgi:hypothetical protein
MMFVARSSEGGTTGTWRLVQVDVSLDTPACDIEAVAEGALRETLADDEATIYWCLWDVPTLGELRELNLDPPATGRCLAPVRGHRRRAPHRVGRGGIPPI